MNWLISFFTGGGIKAIGEQLNLAYETKMRAETDADKIKADMDIEQLKARQAVLIAEQGSWLTSWIRPAIAAPFVIYLWKIIVIDKVLKMGVTDNLPPEIWQMFMVIIGAYFLARPFEKRS